MVEIFPDPTPGIKAISEPESILIILFAMAVAGVFAIIFNYMSDKLKEKGGKKIK